MSLRSMAVLTIPLAEEWDALPHSAAGAKTAGKQGYLKGPV